jgi:hypothetical protein
MLSRHAAVCRFDSTTCQEFVTFSDRIASYLSSGQGVGGGGWATERAMVMSKQVTAVGHSIARGQRTEPCQTGHRSTAIRALATDFGKCTPHGQVGDLKHAFEWLIQFKHQEDRRRD